MGGVKSISSPSLEKNISKRNSFTCFLKISDKFEKSFIRSWIIAILSMVKPSANAIIRPKYAKITFKFVIFQKTLPADLVWSKIKQNWAKLLTIWRHHDVILTLWRRHESIITHNTFMTTSQRQDDIMVTSYSKTFCFKKCWRSAKRFDRMV